MSETFDLHSMAEAAFHDAISGYTNAIRVEETEVTDHNQARNAEKDSTYTKRAKNAETTDHAKLDQMTEHLNQVENQTNGALATKSTKQLRIFSLVLLIVVLIQILIFSILVSVLIRRINNLESLVKSEQVTVDVLKTKITSIEYDLSVINATLEECLVGIQDLGIDNTSQGHDEFRDRLVQIETYNIGTNATLQDHTVRLFQLEIYINATSASLLDSNEKISKLETDRNDDSLTSQSFDSRIKAVEEKTELLEQELKNRSGLLPSANVTSLHQSLENIKHATGLRIGFTLSNATLTNSSMQVFHTEYYNSIYGYNNTIGKFICHYPGMYFFSATIVRESFSQGISSCYIYLNETAISYLISDSYNAAGEHYPSGSNTLVTYLNANDEVYLADCFNLKDVFKLTFSGALLLPDLM